MRFHERDGLVIVKLLSHSNLSISQHFDEAVVRIKDNDLPTGVSVIGFADSVNEGEPVEFLVSLSTPFTQSRTINLNLEQTGNFVQSSLPAEVEIGAFQTSTTLRIPTQNNDIQDLEGSITATILPSPQYRVTTGPGATATVTIRNDDRPLIQISGDNIIESEDAIFTLTSSTPAGFQFSVNMKVTESGDFIANELTTPVTATFDVDEDSTTLVLPVDR